MFFVLEHPSQQDDSNEKSHTGPAYECRNRCCRVQRTEQEQHTDYDQKNQWAHEKIGELPHDNPPQARQDTGAHRVEPQQGQGQQAHQQQGPAVIDSPLRLPECQSTNHGGDVCDAELDMSIGPPQEQGNPIYFAIVM